VKFDPVQQDFSGGEISPRVQGHVGSDIYKVAVARLANLLPSPEGPFASRGGGEAVLASSASAFLVSLDGGPEPGLALEISGTQMRLVNKHGVQSWHERYDLSVTKGWTRTVGLAGYPTDWVWFDEKNDKVYLRGGGNIGTSPQFKVGTGPALRAFTATFFNSGDPITVRARRVSDNAIAGSMACLPGENVFNFTCAADADIIVLDFIVDGVGNKVANVWGLRLFRATTTMIRTGLTLPKVDGSLRYTTFWAYNTFYCICIMPGADEPFGVWYNVATPGDRTTAAWHVIGDVANSFPNPADPKALPLGRKPRITAVTAYQERLWFGFDDGQIRATVSGYGASAVPVVFDFTAPSSPPLAAQSLDLKLSGSSRAITWLVALQGLMMGLLDREMQFSLNQALALDPATGLTFDVKEQSFYGSDVDLAPVAVLDKILFPLRGRKRFRLGGFTFDGSASGFKAGEFSPLGEHLLRPGVRQTVHLRSPIPRVAFLMEDSTLAIATLDGKGNAAWARMSLPAPLDYVHSISGVETAFGSELWMTAAAGGTNALILRFADLDSVTRGELALEPDANPAGDSLLHYFDPTLEVPVMDLFIRRPVTALGSGGTGIEAAPLLDDIAPTLDVFAQRTYIGTVALPASGDVAPAAGYEGYTYVDADGLRQPGELVVGVRFGEHKMRSLPLEGGNPAGTSQGKMSRYTKLWLRLVDSYLPLVNGNPAAERLDGAPIDVLPALVTADVGYQEMTFTRGAILEISQDLPLRVEVSAIFGGAQVNAL
jgi:hypothetical protein